MFPRWFAVYWLIMGFALGGSFVWATTKPINQPASSQASQQTAHSAKTDEPWLTKDAAGFFTFLLAIIAFFQLGLFVWQLWLIRESLDDAKIAADAAKEAADAAKSQAEATLLHARAAVAAELSIVLVPRVDLIAIPDAPPGQPDTIIVGGPLSQNAYRIVIHVLNSGRTRSNISRIDIEWLVIDRTSDTLNPDPPFPSVYGNSTGMAHILIENQLLQFKWNAGTNATVNLTDQQREAINGNAAWLWVYGFVRFSDFMGDTYDAGFCSHWEAVAGSTISAPGVPIPSPIPRGFVMEGPSGYIYRNKVS